MFIHPPADFQAFEALAKFSFAIDYPFIQKYFLARKNKYPYTLLDY